MKQLFYKIKDLLTPYLAVIFVVCMAINMVGFMNPLPSPLRLAVSILVIFTYLTKGVNYRSGYMLFIAYLFINIFLANPDPVFKPVERLLYFLSIFFVVSPIMRGDYPMYIRDKALRVFLWIGIILTTLSLLGAPFGINMMRFEDETIDATERMYEAGAFSGFYSHSMVLAPMSGFSACYVLYNFFRHRNKYLLILLLPCIWGVFVAASRAAFIAMNVSLIVLLYRYLDNRKLFIRYMVVISIFLSITSPVWNAGMEGINSKGSIVTKSGFSSRTNLWNSRIEEFKSSPIYGVGFSSADKRHISVRNTSGVIEPGSSWLAIASMTGIIGLLWVLYFFVKSFRRLWNDERKESILYLSLLTFISIHMISEGYIFAGGSTLCVFAWLVLGCINDFIETHNYGKSSNIF